MVLGVLLLFDGGLLAVGNVPHIPLRKRLIQDPLHRWIGAHYRVSTNVRIFRTETETTWNDLLLRWCRPDLH